MLADRDQILAERRQHLGLAVGDDHQVLDPDPAEALEVDARLDGDDVARRERVARFARKARRLVHLEPDAVAEPMAELVAEAGGFDLVAGGSVGVHAGDAGPRSFEARQLAFERRGVSGLELVRQRAGGEGARAVGVVAVDHRARVDHDRLAGLDRALGRARVRLRRVRARGDDRLEGRPLGTELAEEVIEPPSKLALAAADERLLGEAGVRVARDLPGAADRVQLRLLLDAPPRRSRLCRPAAPRRVRSWGRARARRRAGPPTRSS